MPGGWKPAFRSQSDAWWLETSFQEPITGDQVPAGDQVPGVGNRAPHHGDRAPGGAMAPKPSTRLWSDGRDSCHWQALCQSLSSACQHSMPHTGLTACVCSAHGPLSSLYARHMGLGSSL